MSNISIFKQGGAVTSSRAEGMSELAKSLATNTNNSRRITMNKGKDRKSTRLNSSHIPLSRMPSSA